jgi:outer membrane protein assembly factor BamB
MQRIAIAFAASLLASGWTALASDWTEFRGPAYQGHSDARNVPLEWNATKNVQWKTPIPGKGWSSPVTKGNRIFLTTAVTDGGQVSLRVLALDAASGKIIWDTPVLDAPAVRHHDKNSHASATPVIEGDKLYAHFGHYGTACLDLDGKVLWRQTGLAYSPVHGNGGSPVIVDDALIFNCDGASAPFIAALDKHTGKVLWKVPRQTTAKKTFSFSTPLVIQVKGRKQVITPGSGVVSALDPKDGREIWRVRYGEGYSVVPRPVFGHGLVFISSGYERAVIYAIRPGGTGDVTDTHVAWTQERGAPKSPSMLLAGDELYAVADNGVAICVDARTGQIHWQERVGGNYSASPVLVEGRIYLQNETGTGFVLAPGKEFRVLAENALGERTLSSYAVMEGALLIRTEQHLYRIGSGPLAAR